MLIPIRCMTCGKPVGHLWESYNADIRKGRSQKAALDALGLTRYCCRSLFLTHKDMVKEAGSFKK
jgi:DNA-directed RNA polymerase subunit N (RpoN/RPB10)